MKKIFSILVIVLMSAVAVNAQLVVGGSLGMGGTAPTTSRVDGKLASKSYGIFTMDINPQVGYMMLDRKLEVGMAINMGYDQTKFFAVIDHKSYSDQLSDRSFTLAFVPYAKYDFFEKNGFSLGVKCDLGLGGMFDLADHFYAVKDYRSKDRAKSMNDAAKDAVKDAPVPFVWSLTIAPVLTYMPTEHIRIEAALTGIGLDVAGSVTSKEVSGTKYSTSMAQANLGLLNGASAIQFGCAYVF